MGALGPFNLDTIVVGDCLGVIQQMPDGCVDLVVTSPPYLNARDYSSWESHEDYFRDMAAVWLAVKRTLKPDGRIAVVVAQGYGRHPYLPIGSVITIQLNKLFQLRGHIIWFKDFASSGFSSTAWGSWLSASNPCLRDVHELIIVASNDEMGRSERGPSDLGRDEFMQWTKSVWRLPATNSREHPAVFPQSIPRRLIKLYSFVGDTIFDPFMGSGTTAVAAKKLGRHYFGCDIKPEYVALATKRLARLDGVQLDLPI